MADDTSTTETADASATETDAPPADLGDAGKKALDRMKAERDEARKAAKVNADAAKRLSDLEESQKTEQQKVAERAEAAERRAVEAETRAMRLQVIAEVGLPARLHKYVTGSDEAELRANAQELLAEFSAENRAVDIGLGPRQTPPSADMNTALRRAAGRA